MASSTRAERGVSLVASGGDRTLVHVIADLLRETYPDLPLSNADARRVVIAGAVRVNGRIVARPGAPVRAGDRLTVAADPSRLARTRRLATGPVNWLFVDEHLVAVDKPSGLATHATADSSRSHLVREVAHRLGVDESQLGVHQRLDAGTSGIVLFGRTRAANRGLSAAFAGRAVEKVYLAVVVARERADLRPGQGWRSREALSRGGTGRRGRRVVASPAGEAAETAFLVRGRWGDVTLLEARPLTGRQHQIRAHLAAEQLPILGDVRYGGPPAKRLHLHAWRLGFVHPVTGRALDFEAPPPPGWLDGVFG